MTTENEAVWFFFYLTIVLLSYKREIKDHFYPERLGTKDLCIGGITSMVYSYFIINIQCYGNSERSLKDIKQKYFYNKFVLLGHNIRVGKPVCGKPWEFG